MELTRRGLIRAAGGSVLGMAGLGATGALVAGCTEQGTDKAGPVVSGELRSEYVEEPVGWQICYPPGTEPGDEMPVILALHYFGASAARFVREFDPQDFLADSGHRVAIAAVDGAFDWWHARTNGSDRGRMVVEEFLPMLGRRGLDIEAPGLWGWSMGGWGVLFLTQAIKNSNGAVGPVCAVGAALYPSFAQVTLDAFESQYDYDRMMYVAGIEPRPETRIDMGASDDYLVGAATFVQNKKISMNVVPGDHDLKTWRSLMPEELDWFAEHMGLEKVDA